MRLNKFIASNGILSRRKIDELILQGRVSVNGNEITELGFKIDPGKDKISVDGEAVRTSTKKIYIILNKPQGVITSVSDDKKRTTVIDILGLNEKVFPVGRLDYNTTGLLLLTNDGELANKLMHPKSEIYKTYFVKLSKPLEEKHRLKLTEGIKLEGKETAPSKIRYPKKNNNYQDLFISIYEGRNRQVRNMFEHYGYFVRELERVEYAGLNMEDLRSGEWRKLTPEEVVKLYEIVKDTPAQNTKRVHYAKRDEKKTYRKYKVRDDKRDHKKDFKKSDYKKDFKKDFSRPEKDFSRKESKWGFKDRQIAERDVKLGFNKIDTREDKRDDRRGDKNDDKKDFRKSGRREDSRDVKRGYKTFGKRDDKKFEKKEFKTFGKRDDKKFEKKDFKTFGKRDDKRDVKKDFKTFGKRDDRRDDKRDVKKDFKTFGKRDDKRDDKKFEKKDFKTFGKRDERRDDKRDVKKDFKTFGKKDDRRDDKRDVKKDFKKFDKKNTKRSFKK
ncbi:MAG: rRNA pseudouridine synthase [Ignavibacteria bacterium]|nr:rRNA pseudouridine synthase [Ignavibacteria bacterium]